jgi:hypothetical protein
MKARNLIARDTRLCSWKVICGCALVLALLAPLGAQQPPASSPQLPRTWAQMRHNSGQNIAPVFEGWNKNLDGTFNFMFGYYNRNFIEHPSVPIGTENSFSPGPADRGQPTIFYPRLNRFIFRVIVPADWAPTRALYWTLTVNGKTERAAGTLDPEWMLEDRWDFGGGASEKNQPPILTVNPAASVVLPDVLILEALATDDGNPPDVKRPQRKIVNLNRDAFPALYKGETGPTNVELMPEMPRAPGASLKAGTGAGRSGGTLSIGWALYRGPALAEFTPRNYQVIDRLGGKTTTKVTFKQPGEYVLRAESCDGPLHDIKMVTVTVTGTAAPQTSERP